jgi:hypothetical protein
MSTIHRHRCGLPFANGELRGVISVSVPDLAVISCEFPGADTRFDEVRNAILDWARVYVSIESNVARIRKEIEKAT